MPTLFISMPFDFKDGSLGEKTESLDFNVIWRDVLAPAVPAAWDSIRLDTVPDSGSIPEQSFRHLQEADVVLFDLTFDNPNVFYELGVRHATRAKGVVLVAHQDTELPFDVRHHRVHFYDPEATPRELKSFQENLTRVIVAAQKEEPKGVPAQQPVADAGQLLRRKVRMTQERAARQLERARNLPQLRAIWEDWKTWDLLPSDALLDLAERFDRMGQREKNVEVLKRAYQQARDEPEVVRALGFALRRADQLDEAELRLEEAIDLSPRDVEALGILGGIHKRRGSREEDLEVRRADLERALSLYQRAADIDEDTYHLVNLGALNAMLTPDDLRASVGIYERLIALLEETYVLGQLSLWDQLVYAESLLMTGRATEARAVYGEVVGNSETTSQMLESAADQLTILAGCGVRAEESRGALAVVRSEVQPARAATARDDQPLPVILHLSDIHFGAKTDQSTNEKKPMHRFRAEVGRETLSTHVVREMERIREDHADTPIVMVISGDIAYEATTAEYDEGLEFIETVREKAGLTNSRLVMVPGNHDVNWNLSRDETADRFRRYLVFLSKVYGRDELHHFYPKLRDWDGLDQPDPMSLFCIHDLRELNLVLVGFNSCVFETHESHFGSIGSPQRRLIRKALKGTHAGAIRVGVLHHHVLPMEREIQESTTEIRMDRTLVRDFGVLEYDLHSLGFSLVLHGHKHQPALRESTLHSAKIDMKSDPRSLIICGAGSASVEAEELPSSHKKNHLQVIRFLSRERTAGDPFVHVQWREMRYDNVSEWDDEDSWELPG